MSTDHKLDYFKITTAFQNLDDKYPIMCDDYLREFYELILKKINVQCHEISNITLKEIKSDTIDHAILLYNKLIQCVLKLFTPQSDGNLHADVNYYKNYSILYYSVIPLLRTYKESLFYSNFTNGSNVEEILISPFRKVCENVDIEGKITLHSPGINSVALLPFYKYIWFSYTDICNSNKSKCIEKSKCCKCVIEKLIGSFDKEILIKFMQGLEIQIDKTFINKNLLFDFNLMLQNNTLDIYLNLLNNQKSTHYDLILYFAKITNKKLLKMRKTQISRDTVTSSSKQILEIFNKLYDLFFNGLSKKKHYASLTLRDQDYRIDCILNFALTIMTQFVSLDELFNKIDILHKIGKLLCSNVFSYYYSSTRKLYKYRDNCVLHYDHYNCQDNNCVNHNNTNIQLSVPKLLLISTICWMEVELNKGHIAYQYFKNTYYNVINNFINNEKLFDEDLKLSLQDINNDTKLKQIISRISNKNTINFFDVLIHYFGAKNMIDLSNIISAGKLILYTLKHYVPTQDWLEEYIRLGNPCSSQGLGSLLSFKLVVTNSLIETYLEYHTISNIFEIYEGTDECDVEYLDIYDPEDHQQVFLLLLNGLTEELDKNLIKNKLINLLGNYLITPDTTRCLNLEFNDDTYYACYLSNSLHYYHKYFVGDKYELRRVAMKGTVIQFKKILTKTGLLPDNYCYELAILCNKKLCKFFADYTPTIHGKCVSITRRCKSTSEIKRAATLRASAIKMQTKEYMESICPKLN